jgi:hypothetical protein
MKKFTLFLILCLPGILFAQDNLPLRNGIGWDNGVSYRRHLNGKLWLGFALSGDVRSTLQNDTSFYSTHYLAPDSTANRAEYSIDSSYYYSGTLKIELGEEVFRYNIVGLNALILASYTYQNTNKYSFGGTTPRSNSAPRNILLAGIGVEPVVWITKSLSIGTDFGVQFTYTFGKENTKYVYNSNGAYSENNSTRGTYLSPELKTFGNISLTSGLNAFFWF